MKKNYILFIFLLVIACKEKNIGSFNNDGDESLNSSNGYEDGTYCAEIHYYYSETGTSSTYTLKVEIEDNELTVIHWPNGGWLDNSHFSPPLWRERPARVCRIFNKYFLYRHERDARAS